jgi:hypothetical protein
MTDGSPVRFRIVKKTAKRICHSRAYECLDERGQPDGSGPRDYRDYEDNIGFVDRQEREAKGCVYNRGRGQWGYSSLYAFEGCLPQRDRRAMVLCVSS